MALFAIVATVIGVGYASMQRQERFASGAQAIAQKLQTATQLMLLHGADVRLSFTPKEGSYLVNFETDAPRQESARSLLKNQTISGVEKIFFIDEEGVSNGGAFTLLFSSTTLQTPRGVVEMRTRGSVKSIAMEGHPHPYKVVEGVAKLPPVSTENVGRLYPEKIRERFNELLPQTE